MTRSHILLMTLQTMACIALLYSIICRAKLMDHDTARELRWAFVFWAAATVGVLVSPVAPIIWPEYFLGGGGLYRWKPWRTPWSAYVFFCVAAAFVQASAARLWQQGVPHQFQRANL